MAPLVRNILLISPILAAGGQVVVEVVEESFTVDIAGATVPFDATVQTKCVGSSHAATALRADWRQQLTKVHQELGPEFVRFHGLFDDDMSVVIKGGAATEQLERSEGCTFVKGQDYSDPGGPVFPTATQEECCDACYNQPTGLAMKCIAAVWAPWDGGKCYVKLSSNDPVQREGSPIVSCATNRPSPKGFHYSWMNIFSVFDFLQSIGMRPIVELGFMPSILASDPSNTVFWYEGGISPPSSWDDWRDFISSFTSALIDRYGAAEVHEWYFEVWNEPNCGFYDVGLCCGPTCGNKTAYMEMFTNTFEAIKGVDSEMRVGGPATAQLGWLAEFVTNATAAGSPPDFVTTHLYPTDPFVEHDRDGFSNAIAHAADEVAAASAAANIGTPQILLTEFNCGLSIDCADAPFAGSFVAHNAFRSQAMLESVPLQSYWTFSDIFEEQGQQSSEFNQAFGMQSFNGVPKPIYRVLQLLGRLHDSSVAVVPSVASKSSSIDVIVTKQEGSVEIMVSNHPSMTEGTQATNLAHGLGQSVDDDSVDVTIIIEGVGSAISAEQIELRRVDADNSNAVKAYNQMGRPAYPNSTALASLQSASEFSVVHPAASMNGDVLTITLNMPAYSVASVSFNTNVALLV